MFNKKLDVLGLFTIFGLGVFVGWFANGIGQGQEINSPSTSVNSSATNLSASMGVDVDLQNESAGSNASKQTAVASTSPPDLLQDSAQAKAQIAMDEMRLLEDKIKQDPFNTDLLNEVGVLVERYLSSSQRAWGDIPALVYLSDKHPLLLQRSLDYITQDLSQEGATEKYERFVRGLGYNEEYRNAERYMLSKVKSGESIDQWFAWTQIDHYRDSLKLVETAEYMLSVMPSLTDATDLSIAIAGVVGPGEQSFSTYFNVSDREKFERLLTPLFDSEDEKLRMQALNTLSVVPRSDSDKLLIKAMSDPSEDVRVTSYSHFFQNEIHNRDVADAMLARINDASVDFGERELALNVLGSNNRIHDLDDVIRNLKQQFAKVDTSSNGG